MISAMVDFVKNESAVSETERDFQKWCKQVSQLIQLIGISFDKDLAFDLFTDGCSVEDAVTEMTPK